jgi:peptidoglycan/LPS O-acetylase OafA/YrhL
VAALSVLVVHFAIATDLVVRPGWEALSRLDLGVSVFFVISGFLLYRPFVVAHLEARAAPRFRPFMRRRLLRIVPAYWVALTIIGLSGGLQHVDGWGLPLYFGFAHVYVLPYALGGMGQAWSLCTEMSFYLVLPAYAWLVGRGARDRAEQIRVELWVLAAVYAGSFAFGAITGHLGMWDSNPTMRLWLPAKADQFALGMFLAVVSAAWAGRPSAAMRVLGHPRAALVSWGIAFLIFWVVAYRVVVPPIVSVEAALELELFYGLIGFFLVFPAVIGSHAGGVVRSFLRSRPMQFAGLVSYGIYLWHQKAIRLVVGWTGGERRVFGTYWPEGRPSYIVLLVLSVALTVTIAALSYYVVERRFLRLKRKSGENEPRAAPTAALTSIDPSSGTRHTGPREG